MIKVKLEKNKKDEPVLKMAILDEIIDEFRILKRVIFESKAIKRGEYNYKVPMRFFQIVIKSIPKERIEYSSDSIDYYLEFSDDYDDKYYYRTEANASYMRKWREEGCPNIYKININKETLEISKEIAFRKINNINI